MEYINEEYQEYSADSLFHAFVGSEIYRIFFLDDDAGLSEIQVPLVERRVHYSPENMTGTNIQFYIAVLQANTK